MKAGDKIVCVHLNDLAMSRYWYPEIGKIYTLHKIDKSKTHLYLKEDPHQNSWSISRFQKLTKKRSLPGWF